MRGVAKPINGEAAALSEVSLVCIKLEDLLLAQALLHQQGQKNLLELTPESAAAAKKEIAGHLHGERAATLRPLLGADVRDRRPQDAVHIHAVVRKDAGIFGGT